MTEHLDPGWDRVSIEEAAKAFGIPADELFLRLFERGPRDTVVRVHVPPHDLVYRRARRRRRR